MTTLTLKSIPDDLHAQLKESAVKNRRSLNSEILVRLERSLVVPVADTETSAKELEAFTSRLPPVDHARVSRHKRLGRA